MLPIKIHGATRELGKPEDWDEEQNGECTSLFVREDVQLLHRVLASAWKPSEEELAALQAGGYVVLHVWGNGHPPVTLSVETAELEA